MHNAAQMHINQKTYYCKRDWWHQTIRQHQGKIWPPSQNPSSPPVVECTSGDRINMSDAFCGNGMAFSAKSSTAANKLLCIRIMPTVCSHQIFSFAKKNWNQKFKIWAAIWGRIFFQGSGQSYKLVRIKFWKEKLQKINAKLMTLPPPSLSPSPRGVVTIETLWRKFVVFQVLSWRLH